MKSSPVPVIVIAIVAMLMTGCRDEMPTQEIVRTVRAMKVADFAGMTKRTFPGRAKATQEVDLAFRVAGPLVAFPVKVGDEVEEGDLIARIDPRDFQVTLRNAEGSLQRAKANQQRGQSEYDRALELHRKGAGSQAEVDEAKELLDVATADIVALEASVDSAKDALGDTDLLAPYAGTIVASYVENFQNVREKQMIARLLDTTRIEFEVNIPETLISMVPYVEDLHVTFDAFPDVQVPAEVSEVGNEASQTTRTFPVTLIMDQPEGAVILPGMAGRVAGTARKPDEEQLTIVIPVTAVFSPEAENKSLVWVIDQDSNTVGRRHVEIDRLVSAGYVISSGLEPGEMIATAGVNFLAEAQHVRPEIP